MKKRELVFNTQWRNGGELKNAIICTIKNWEMILNTQWWIEKSCWIHNEELRNNIPHTMKKWEMKLYMQWRIEKWYYIHNEELGTVIVYKMKKSEMIMNTQRITEKCIKYTMKKWEINLYMQWRIQKWYYIHKKELRNDIVHRKKNWEMIFYT